MKRLKLLKNSQVAPSGTAIFKNAWLKEILSSPLLVHGTRQYFVLLLNEILSKV
jgi:hypothetical protein